MPDLIITVLVVLCVLLCFAILVVVCTTISLQGGIKDTWQYYKGAPTYRDWLVAGLATILGVGILGTLNHARADDFEPEWLQYTEIYFGLDYQKENPVCASGGFGDYLSANAGLRQHIVGYELPIGRLDGVLNYTHHSCAIAYDENIYDGAGLMMVYRVDW